MLKGFPCHNLTAPAVVICFAGTLFGQELGRAPRRLESQAPAASPQVRAVPYGSTNWVDTSNRTTVRNWFLNQWLPTIGIPTDWSGDVPAGIWGTTSQQYKDNVAARLNLIRALAGVPPSITLDPVESEKDQEAAMMMSANNQLSHSPPMSWVNYTANGADAAAHSNICLGWALIYDGGCVLSYVQDFGSSNAEAGHRRWLLYPQTQIMGTGDVTPNATPPNANALWAFDANFGGPRPATRDTFAAWPPPGFVPYPFIFPRWSFAYPGADFSSATVSMTQNGTSIPVRLETLINGYGENTLVWVPNNLSVSTPYTPVRPANDITFTVTVGQVMINGSPQKFTYTVTEFDPAPPPVTVTVVSSPPQAGAFVDGNFTASGTQFSWTPGDTHTISNAIHSGGPAFLSWSDGGADAHAITVPSTNTTLTVTYTATNYTLTTAVVPAGGGAIALNPTSANGSYTAGASVQVTAQPASGYQFTGFTGDLSGTTNPQSIVMNAAHSVTAQFACAYSLSSMALNTGASATQGTINITTGAGCAWNITGGATWLILTSPAAGTGSGSFSYSAAQNLTGQSRTASFSVSGKSFTVTQAGTSSSLPFGSFDTPADNTTGVSGALAVTGWALGLNGIQNVAISREPVGSEPAGPNGLVFLVNAVIVPGARPDVAGAFPGYPNNNAGWGAQVLTNLLPNGGNGTYRLHVVATDFNGQSLELGVHKFTADNSHATIPFGTIDTPAQGATVSGTSTVDFGWALTPNPANLIPKDGSTITVLIDSKPVGHPTYNQFRVDIATLFPGLQNTGGAVGYLFFDTTKLTNGIHTIAWVVTDNAGNSQGLGSRYFFVAN